MSLEAYEAGYEPVGTSPAQFELHEYDSIRLSQLYAPIPGADQSEYEMMESVQCLDDTATNKGFTNTQGVRLAVQYTLYLHCPFPFAAG